MARSAASASTNPRRASVPCVVSIRIIVLDATERSRHDPSQGLDIFERSASNLRNVQKGRWGNPESRWVPAPLRPLPWASVTQGCRGSTTSGIGGSKTLWPERGIIYDPTHREGGLRARRCACHHA